MKNKQVTTLAHPNIAFIKYWGNTDHDLRIPVNPSLSMNLEGLHTQTTVEFSDGYTQDTLSINDSPVKGPGLERVSVMLDRVRKMAAFDLKANVQSENNFPTGSGIASSAAAFAALALAASKAAGLSLNEADLSRLARTGSGSASRSIPGGFVEWYAGTDHESSYAETIAAPDHWDLVDCVTIVSKGHKKTGSTGGHKLASTSPLQVARVADAQRRFDICRKAIIDKDFETFANIVEEDSNAMHGVMMTSTPRLLYWEPATLAVMKHTQQWREDDGLSTCYTIDAGPNVHVLCLSKDRGEIKKRLRAIPGVLDVRVAAAGGPARTLQNS